MATKRDLSLTPRIENQREAQPITPPVQFSLDEIKQHFIDSMNTVKAQYDALATRIGLRQWLLIPAGYYKEEGQRLICSR